jgi:phosphate transport system permease protein
MELKNILSYWLVFLGSATALIGFSSAAFSFYIGDICFKLLLILIGTSFLLLLATSFKIAKQKRSICYLIVFALISYALAYLIPSAPPSVGLRVYSVDASLLKFLVSSLVLLIVGLIGVSLSSGPLYNFTKHARQTSAYFFLIISILLILYPLGLIISEITINGISGITWEFLTQDVSKHGAEGGVFPVLIGTLFLIGLTALIALPLGVGCAIFLQEYARKGKLVRIIRTAVNILQGTPSIVHGLFGLALFVPLFGISLLTGALIMGFLTLPIVIRASEEALRSIPQRLREGSYALGATQWQTIRHVVLPPALPGIITGVVLGLGRAAGETAPIMFTAVYFIGAGIPKSLLEPIQALPYHLLELTRYWGAYPVEQNAWATAFLLLAIVLGMNAVGIIIREKYRQEF